ALYSTWRSRMARATSGDTTPRLISQSKKVSPSSPDHNVPSQSNAATWGASRKTESRNCVLVEVSLLTISMHFDDTVHERKCAIAGERRRPSDCNCRFR